MYELLSCGIDLESRANDGATPLVVASDYGNAETVKFLNRMLRKGRH